MESRSVGLERACTHAATRVFTPPLPSKDGGLSGAGVPNYSPVFKALRVDLEADIHTSAETD